MNKKSRLLHPNPGATLNSAALRDFMEAKGQWQVRQTEPKFDPMLFDDFFEELMVFEGMHFV